MTNEFQTLKTLPNGKFATYDDCPIVKDINGWRVVDGGQHDRPQHSSPQAAADWWFEIKTIEGNAE